MPQKLNMKRNSLFIDKVANITIFDNQKLRHIHADLIDTPYFQGPFDPVEAESIFLKYHLNTHPTLVYKCDDGYYIVFP